MKALSELSARALPDEALEQVIGGIGGYWIRDGEILTEWTENDVKIEADTRYTVNLPTGSNPELTARDGTKELTGYKLVHY